MDKKNTRIWSISLFVISIITIIWGVCNLAGIVLPDMVIRVMGVLDIVVIPVLIYTSIKIRKK